MGSLVSVRSDFLASVNAVNLEDLPDFGHLVFNCGKRA